MKRKLILVAIVLVLFGGAWLGLQGLERSYNRDMRFYSVIEDGLYVGGNLTSPPPGTQAVLNLCEFEDRYECEVNSWQPIPDAAPAPSLEWLKKQVEFVAAQREAGRAVYVHCAAGVSRSGMVATAYIMSKYGWSRDKALEYVRSKRSQVRPNPAFMELLLEWEKNIAPANAAG